MKKQYCMMAALIMIAATCICLTVYADKEHHGKKLKLPEAVSNAIAAMFPQAEIEEAKAEEEGIKVYEVEVEDGDAEYELTLTPDGILIEQEEEISFDSLPLAVQQSIGEGEIEEVTKEVTYYVVTLKKLDVPKVTYEVEMEHDDKDMEIELAEDGTILEKEVKKDDDDDDDHDDDDDDDD